MVKERQEQLFRSFKQTRRWYCIKRQGWSLHYVNLKNEIRVQKAHSNFGSGLQSLELFCLFWRPVDTWHCFEVFLCVSKILKFTHFMKNFSQEAQWIISFPLYLISSLLSDLILSCTFITFSYGLLQRTYFKIGCLYKKEILLFRKMNYLTLKRNPCCKSVFWRIVKGEKKTGDILNSKNSYRCHPKCLSAIYKKDLFEWRLHDPPLNPFPDGKPICMMLFYVHFMVIFINNKGCLKLV